jgi:UDP-glucose 4-epimerase
VRGVDNLPFDTRIRPCVAQVVYLAACDTEGGRSLAEEVRHRCGASVPLRTPLSRPDASGIDCTKARRLLGWEPKLTWRDYLNAEGRLRPEPPGGWP